jgi:hypothetical protein
MSSPITIQLKNIDPEDIGDVLQKVEKSFGFKFGETDLKDVKTFGEVCDIITNRVQDDNSSDCTTQQAFYKLRDAIAATQSINKSILTVDARLQDLFPKKQRWQQINAVESVLGFQTKILRPKHWITTFLALLLLASFVGLFFYWQAGMVGLAFSIAGFWFSERLGKELDLSTLGELAEKIAREHYKNVRRNPATINRNEVAEKVKELFIIDLDLEEKVLTRESTFG